MTESEATLRCVFDDGELRPVYQREPVGPHTVIGSPAAPDTLAHWACARCGLLYSAGIMPDPAIEQRRLKAAAQARREQDARQAWLSRYMGMFTEGS